MQTRSQTLKRKLEETTEQPNKTINIYGYFTPLIAKTEEIDIEHTDNETDPEIYPDTDDEGFISDNDDIFDNTLFCNDYGIIEFISKYKT